MPLLTQNRELRPIGVWNWSLPAWVVTLPDGRNVNVCPSADACVKVCYARNGTYLFKNVRAAHLRNLQMVLDNLPEWEEAMVDELLLKKFRPTGIARDIAGLSLESLDSAVRRWAEMGGAAIRIHDSGDFLNEDYLRAWLRIARSVPDVLFYAYTKEVPMFRRIAQEEAPPNFRWLYSMGGKWDHLIDKDTERHAEVFPDEERLEQDGYLNQEASDLWAILLPTTRIGIPANNIKHFNTYLNGRTFGEVQQERDAKRHRKLT